MNSNLKLLKNTLTLGLGAASAQFLGILAVPVLARVFNAQDFGLFAMFFLGSQLLGTCFAARYEQAIMVSEEKHVGALTALCISLAFFSALMSAFALTMFARDLDRIFDASLGWAWPMTSLAAFFVSLSVTFTMLASRNRSYGIISSSRLSKAIASIFIQAALGLTIFPGVWGLIIGETFASIASAIILMMASNRSHIKLNKMIFFSGRYVKLISIVSRRYGSFPKFSLPQFLINSLSGFVLIAIILRNFSPGEAGQYFMMQRIVTIPAGIISVAVSQILYLEAHQQLKVLGRFDGSVIRAIILQLFIGIPLFVALFFFGSWIFPLVLGTEWTPSGRLAELFAPYVVVHLVLSALAPVPVVANRQRAALVLSIVQNTIFVGGFFLPAWLGMSLEEALSISIYTSIPYMVFLILLFLFVSRSPELFSSVTADHFSGVKRVNR